MVTAKTQYNLKNAEEYFEEHLAVGDCYDEGQRVAGEWFGAKGERLGLTGKGRADDETTWDLFVVCQRDKIDTCLALC